MRKGLLGSIAGLTAGAGAAWGQPGLPVGPGSPPPPAAIAPATAQYGDVVPAGAAYPPAPVIMPPVQLGGPGPSPYGMPGGMPGDPAGMAGMGGPPGLNGPGPAGPQPPTPMWPPPGPYTAPMFQPPPPPVGAGGHGAGSGGVSRFWFTPEYMLMFAAAQPVPFPLVTTSAPADGGLLGRQSTLVLVGNEALNYEAISGFRVTAGFWGDPDRRVGAEGSGFATEQKANIQTFNSSPNGTGLLARPFIDSGNLFAQNAVVIAAPNFGSGTAQVATRTQTWGAEGSLVLNLFRSEPDCTYRYTFDVLLGYRFLELEEDLGVFTSTILNITPTTVQSFIPGPFGTRIPTGTTVVNIPVPVGGVNAFSPAVVETRDYVRTLNRFNGGQVGFKSEFKCGMWSINTIGKVAIGNMNHRIDIQGNTGFNDAQRGIVSTGYGGVLATNANIGRYNDDELAFIPEASIGVGLNISRGVVLTAAYNIIYVTDVVRPGNQLTNVVNGATVPFTPAFGSQIVRPAPPATLFTQEDFWLMGVNFGITFKY